MRAKALLSIRQLDCYGLQLVSHPLTRLNASAQRLTPLKIGAAGAAEICLR
jgi:hypothetical protein